MSRLSIDLTPEQHKFLKAKAAIQGCSIKDFVIAQVFRRSEPDDDETPCTEEELSALQELRELLEPRIAQARRGEFSTKTVTEIFEEAITKREAATDV